jgi:hypothetical protein
LTEHFDRWSARADFVFGIDAHKKLIGLASGLAEDGWRPLKRREKYVVKTEPRQRPENVKERIVEEQGYRNFRLVREDVAEFRYRPTKCKRDYRVIALRKTIHVMEGQRLLFPEVHYFFYITTRTDLSAAAVVRFANERCDQENLIEQLKNGVNAMRMPVNNLVSNWAYMVMTSLAWTLKAWFALCMRLKRKRQEVLAMEFRRFLHSYVLFPCQIVGKGRRLVYRLLGYNPCLRDFFSTFKRIKAIRPCFA